MKKITYKAAGVDVDAGNEFIKKIKGTVKKTHIKGVMSQIGGFGGLFSLEPLGFNDPVLVTSADGVGTKLMLAIEMGVYDTIGIDAVAMNVNDILTIGAKPLFFLDYLAIGKLKVDVAVKIIKGVARGCEISRCALIGGETAEMPGIYKKNDFDLAGFCVGAVEREKIINGENINSGDVVIGLKSSGFHSNGYSLVRKIINTENLNLNKVYKGFKKKLGDVVLEPTKIYCKKVEALLDKVEVKGMAHITGGGFKDKLGRIIPDGLCAKINRNTWRLPLIFKFFKEKGNLPDDELYRVFNCGIGYTIVVDSKLARNVMDHFGAEAVEIGYIEPGDDEKVELL